MSILIGTNASEMEIYPNSFTFLFFTSNVFLEKIKSIPLSHRLGSIIELVHEN